MEPPESFLELWPPGTKELGFIQASPSPCASPRLAEKEAGQQCFPWVTKDPSAGLAGSGSCWGKQPASWGSPGLWFGGQLALTWREK